KNLFARSGNIFVLFLLFSCFTLAVQAQDKQLVTGSVLDANGAPLTGASVIEIGTTNGVVADFDGKFSIEATTGSTLEISFLGYVSQSVEITNSTVMPLQIVLEEDAFALDAIEIVAVGYGTMRKSDLTGAISTVSEEELVKGSLTSTEQVLQGKVSGLVVTQGTGDPSSGSSLRLRGGTSLTASNNPLVVVDGIPGVDINAIQPSDIKSIDVLKDA